LQAPCATFGLPVKGIEERMSTIDEQRLMTKIAKMYYEWDLNQTTIAKQLGISQATVSRLFNRAKEEGIIRISVNIPSGVHADLEGVLVKKYSLKDAIVVDSIRNDDNQIMRDLGSAAAYYLETVIKDNEVIGISSWSSTLLAMIDAMHPVPNKNGVTAVQILGGVGNPSAEIHAARLTSRLANLVNGSAIFLPTPGVVGSEAALKVLMEDEYVNDVIKMFDTVTLALVGIGSIEPSRLLSLSGNIFSQEEQDFLREKNAVGDILLRFFNAQGKPIESSFNNRVISMQLEQLRRVKRSVGIAGGAKKYQAVLGALNGRWINVLITDRLTAEKLIRDDVE
jgi:DNA-binding transcriptional regulator LsrR (DeoR family)